MRAAIVDITPAILAKMLGLPDSIRLRWLYVESGQNVKIVLEGEIFPEVEEGAAIPNVQWASRVTESREEETLFRLNGHWIIAQTGEVLKT